MKVVLSALLALFASLAAPAAAATVPAGIMTTINAVLNDTNANNLSKLDSYYTSDAVVVDEFPPYMWTGAKAGSTWWGGLMQTNKKMAISNMKAAMSGSIQHFNVAGDKAYVVVPLTVNYAYKGKPQKETGTLTLTMQRSGNAWKIATQTWGTTSNTM